MYVCENFYSYVKTNTVKRQPEGKSMVRLPFKENCPSKISSGSSKSTISSGEEEIQYQQALQAYINFGHMKEVIYQEPSTTKHFSKTPHANSSVMEIL